jgi:hypothetical protein
MPVYNLYLATQGATQSPYTSNATWRINWEDIFASLPKTEEYKKCLCKFWLQSTTLEATASLEYASRAGFLVANFQSLTQRTSIGTNQFGGTVLGQIAPLPIVQYSTSATAGSTTYQYVRYDCGTLQTKGVEIIRPTGLADLNIQLYAYPNSASNPAVQSTYDGDYTLMLEFYFEEE